MTDMERGIITAEYVKQIMIGVDMILSDEENLAYLEQSIDAIEEKLAIGYAFPICDTAKLDKLAAENAVVKAIFALCARRLEYRKMLEQKQQSLDAAILSALGLL